MRPRYSAAFGSKSSRTSALTRAKVPASSAAISPL